MNLSGAATVVTAVMVHLVAPVAAVDSAVDLVVPVERVVVPVVDPVPRKAHKARAVDRNAGIVLPVPAVMVALLADAMVALAFALRVSARPRPRRCPRSTLRSRPKI